MNITPYEQGNRYNHDPVRTRKLLLHRKEIEKLIGAVEQKGLTLVPLELYFKNGRAKVAIALGRGKKQHDKREDLKRRVDRARDGPRRLRPGTPVIAALVARGRAARRPRGALPQRSHRRHAPGEARIPVRLDPAGSPVVPAAPLLTALGGSCTSIPGGPTWSSLDSRSGSSSGRPSFQFSSQLLPLAGAASLAGDTLFLPFQFVAEILPYYLGDQYR